MFAALFALPHSLSARSLSARWPKLAKHSVSVMGSAGLLALITPTQAGFLEVLFGQPNNRSSFVFSPPQPNPLTPEEDTERQKQNRLASERKMSEQAGRNLKIFRVLADIAHEQGRKQAFLMDPTLRYGDIVVTDTGLEVYEGKSWKERSPLQFRPLHLSALRNRKDLQVLQRVSGFPTAPEDVQTASAIRTLTIIGQTNAKPAQVRETEAQPTAAQTRTGIPAPKVSKPRVDVVRAVEVVRPAQVRQAMNSQTMNTQVMNSQTLNRQAQNNQAKAPLATTRNQNTQNNYISQNSVSPLVANIFYLFR